MDSSHFKNSSEETSQWTSEGSEEKNKGKQLVRKNLQSLSCKKNNDDDDDDFDPNYDPTKDDDYQSYINIHDNVSKSPLKWKMKQ